MPALHYRDCNQRFNVSWIETEHIAYWQYKVMLLHELQEWAERELPKLIAKGLTDLRVEEVNER